MVCTDACLFVNWRAGGQPLGFTVFFSSETLDFAS